MSFDRVCREWRCKYEGDKATSESLEAIAKVVDEFLPKIKAVSSGATVNRMICGGCLDFKLQTTVSLFYCNDIDGYMLILAILRYSNLLHLIPLL